MEKLKDHLAPFALGVVVALLCVAAYNAASARLEPESVNVIMVGEQESDAADSVVCVHVVGQVVDPGVYTLSAESRVLDAVNLAGGFCSGADQQAVNLAAHLLDAQQIFVPELSESGESQMFAGQVNALLDLNSASIEQFEELPGVGPVTAADIVRYRTEQGAFESCEGLLEVPGIGDVTYSRIKELVIVY